MSRLGRIHLVDERDRQFPMAAVLQAKPLLLTPPTSREWVSGPILDQANTPYCTAYSWRAHLNAEPYPEPLRGPDPDTLYAEEKTIDGLPPGSEGSTVRAGAEILRQADLIQAYVWAWDEATVRQWVLTRSPVAFGSPWYYSMFSPDRTGLLTVDLTSGIAGGHAYLCVGFDGTTSLYKFENSWGTNWGSSGYFFMHAKDVAFLLAAGDSEACTVLNDVPNYFFLGQSHRP